MLGLRHHSRAFLRCRGLVDEILKMGGAHLKRSAPPSSFQTVAMLRRWEGHTLVDPWSHIAAVACADVPGRLQTE